MQFCFMTALLMRWQVIPANSVVLCYRSNFCHPSGSYATEGKKIIITIITRETTFLFQRLSVALPKRKCGFFPQHHGHRVNCRMSSLFFFCLRLCAGGLKNNNDNCAPGVSDGNSSVSRRQQITLRATLIFHLIDGLLSTTAAHEVQRTGVLTCGSCHLERSARPHPHRG